MDKAINTRKPTNPTISPNFIFPLAKKIEYMLPPEILVSTIIEATTSAVLDNIAKTKPFIVEV
jgi:hypothetical protein